MNTYEEEKQMVSDAIAQFPPQFGLRGFPGEVFRLSTTASYVSEGRVQLYTQIKKALQWFDFAKATPNELRAEIVEV
jgi:hypothetical protein